MLTCLFSIVNVLVDDKGGTSSILASAHPDLTDSTVFTEDVVHLF